VALVIWTTTERATKKLENADIVEGGKCSRFREGQNLIRKLMTTVGQAAFPKDMPAEAPTTAARIAADGLRRPVRREPSRRPEFRPPLHDSMDRNRGRKRVNRAAELRATPPSSIKGNTMQVRSFSRVNRRFLLSSQVVPPALSAPFVRISTQAQSLLTLSHRGTTATQSSQNPGFCRRCYQ
jgi:hypothetical protein